MSRNPELIDDVIRVVASSLDLDTSDRPLDAHSPLLDHLPELDSMAIVQLLVDLEDHFHFEIDEDELSGDVFETIASLADFVERHVPVG